MRSRHCTCASALLTDPIVSGRGRAPSRSPPSRAEGNDRRRRPCARRRRRSHADRRGERPLGHHDLALGRERCERSPDLRTGTWRLTAHSTARAAPLSSYPRWSRRTAHSSPRPGPVGSYPPSHQPPGAHGRSRPPVPRGSDAGPAKPTRSPDERTTNDRPDRLTKRHTLRTPTMDTQTGFSRRGIRSHARHDALP